MENRDGFTAPPIVVTHKVSVDNVLDMLFWQSTYSSPCLVLSQIGSPKAGNMAVVDVASAAERLDAAIKIGGAGG